MGTYGLDGVILAWRTGSLTTEQAVGQILLLLREWERRLQALENHAWPPGAETKPSKSQSAHDSAT